MTPPRYKAGARLDTKSARGGGAGVCPGSPRAGAIRPSPPQNDRHRAIAEVLPVWPHELDDETLAGRERLLTRPRNALRAERRRGVSGHWSSDLARHVELLRIYRAELAAVRRCRIGSRAPPLSCEGEMAAYFSRRVPRPICLASCERAAA